MGSQTEQVAQRLCDLDPDLCIDLGQLLADLLTAGAGILMSRGHSDPYPAYRW